MSVSTVVAAGFLVTIACILIWMVWSLIVRSPSLRRGSGNPGTPPNYGSMSGAGSDCGGSSGGDSGGS